MMEACTYLLVNFLTCVICFIYSFHKKIQFNRQFTAFLKAITVVGAFFIAWDIWFTRMGVWWFNEDYTLGYKISGLPIEEWLFFICIPFSCVFTYFCLDKFFNLDFSDRFNGIIVLCMEVICLMIVGLFGDRLYPLVTASVTMVVLLYLYFVVKASWIGRGTVVYLVLLPGFLTVNGILTGTGLESPVVNYNPEEILNLRIRTIPIEDLIYGYTQFMLSLYFFKMFQKKKDVKGSQISIFSIS